MYLKEKTPLSIKLVQSRRVPKINHVIETWNGLPGVFEAICFQHDFDAKPEFYFLLTNEWDEDGKSNDKEGKYFKGFGRLTTLEDHWIGK